jgi:inorganic pyrophosphatase
MNIESIPIGKDAPNDINVVIEVPVGGEPIKYEMDKASGALFVDRFLYTSMRYPGNYGFVPNTLSDDGDAIDVLIASTRAINPGAVINCRPIGVLIMKDEAGQDEKVIAVPSNKLTLRYKDIANVTDLPKITLDQIEHFFAHYKDLESEKWVELDRWGDAAEARDLISQSMAAYAEDAKKK